MSRDWTDDFYEITGPGEVYDAARNFNARRAIPEALGTHNCGDEEWFAKGVPFDPAREPVEYDEETGLPTCCNVVPETGALLANGSAPWRLIHYYYPTGGLVGNGTAPLTILWPWYPTGGLVGNGTAPLSVLWELDTTGGLLGDGTAPWALVFSMTTTGGLVGNGTSPFVFTPPGSTPPSNLCATAYASTLTTLYPGTLILGDEHWRSYPVNVGMMYFVNASANTGPLDCQVWEGLSCGTMVFVAGGPLPFTMPIFATGTDTLYIRIFSPVTTASYTLIVN